MARFRQTSNEKKCSMDIKPGFFLDTWEENSRKISKNSSHFLLEKLKDFLKNSRMTSYLLSNDDVIRPVLPQNSRILAENSIYRKICSPWLPENVSKKKPDLVSQTLRLVMLLHLTSQVLRAIDENMYLSFVLFGNYPRFVSYFFAMTLCKYAFSP